VSESMSEEYRIRFLVIDDEHSIRKLCVTIGNSLDSFRRK